MQPPTDEPGGEPALTAAAQAPRPAPAGRTVFGGLAWWLVAGIIVADQATKALVARTIPLYSSKPLIPGFADLVHVQNAGVAFGLLNDPDHAGRRVMTTVLALAALAGIAYYARHVHPHERVARMGLSLILGGAIGNLIDRLRQGYVLDFVDLYWRDWHFWAFNVADAAITAGAVLICLELFLPRRHASDPV